jgi:hypothetical protein
MRIERNVDGSRSTHTPAHTLGEASRPIARASC